MTTPAPRPCCPCPPPGTAAGFLLCDCPTGGGACTQFVRIFFEDGTTQDSTLAGDPYTPTGTVGQCTGDELDGCDTTTPIAVANLCLADGTPIVVVVQRDCDGTISAPGWVTLTTGAYTAGPVPADAAPCDAATAGSAGRIPLCDVQPDGTVVGFLRAISSDGAITDTTITGAPYTPTGTVRLCSAIEAEQGQCASPTEPVATTGLCLADSTPIAITVERDCDGVVTRTGWMNLSTGAWSAGAPPAGTRACGETAAFDVSGVLCDIATDGSGDVLGLVLIEVERGPDGEITGVRLINAADGTEYTLQGELSVCPAGVQQPEKDLTVLCDVAADGTATPFLRDYARDENGVITGHSSYTLAGAPYTPTGDVGVCGSPCVNTETVEMCDSSAAPVRLAVANTDPTPYENMAAARQALDAEQAAAIWRGETGTVPASTTLGMHTFAAAVVSLASDPCGDPDEITISGTLHGTNNGPTAAEAVYGRFSLWNGTTQVGADLLTGGLPIGASFDAVLPPTTVPLADVLAGNVVVEFNLESNGESNTQKSWTVDGFTITGETSAPGCGRKFLRTIVRNCDGAMVSTVDTSDGVTPYAPVGAVGLCTAGENTDCETVELCDRQREVSAVLGSTGSPTEQWNELPNGVRWLREGRDGAVPGGWYMTDSTSPERFRFDRPVEVRYAVRFSSGTAAPVVIPDGWVLDSLVAAHTWDAATRTLSPTGSATTALVSTFKPDAAFITEMIAPTLARAQTAGQQSQYGQITVTTDVITPFLRTVCRDSDGAVVSVGDTTVDATTAYAPVGEVGACAVFTTATPSPVEQFDTESWPMCVLNAAGEVVRHVRATRRYRTDSTGAMNSVTFSDPATGTGDTLGTGERYAVCPDTPPCPVSFATECIAQNIREWSYDNTSGFGGDASNCGSVQGPGTPPSIPCGGTGQYQVIEWVIDGTNVVTTPVAFAKGACGDLSGNGMHDNWADVLTQLDPSATWVPASNATCGWYVHTHDAPEGRVYGRMRLRNSADTTQVWTLGPNNTTAENRFTRLYTQECDGTVTVSWLDEAGQPTTAPTGDLTSCGGGECCDRPTPICYEAAGVGDECSDGELQDLPVVNPAITSSSVAANPNGFTVNGLSASHDGALTTWTTITLDATGAAPGLVLRYNFAGPADIAQLSLWNQYGGILSDNDGIGAATLTVYDAAANQLWQGALNAGDGGAPFVTNFGQILRDASYFTLSNITRQTGTALTQIGWREIAGVGLYRALITWDCPGETITAAVEGAQAGITYDGQTITQTNGPHTFTFSSSVGAFTASLDTDNAAAWSTLQVSDSAPDTVLSGNATLSLNVIAAAANTIRAGWLNRDGTVTDMNTGEVITDATVVPCVAPEESDHVVTAEILPMCEDGHPFLRHVRVTRENNVLITDTEIDGRTPYTVVNPAAVQAGHCERKQLGDVCAELGPLLAPSALAGFVRQGDCLVTQGQADPTATYTGTIESIELTQDTGVAGGPRAFRLLLDGTTQVLSTAFAPAMPAGPTTVSEYVGTATVGGITITAELVSGSVGRAGTAFGLAGRMRFTFSSAVASVQIQTANWPDDPNNRICDVVALPSAASDPQRLAAFRAADGTVTYYAMDGTEIVDPVLLPYGECGDGQCQHAETVELADSAPLPATLSAVRNVDWSPRYLTAGDSTPAVLPMRKDVPGGGGGFWGGGSTVFPNLAADGDGGNDGVHYGIAGVVSAGEACPDCLAPSDMVTITASGSATNNGPGNGFLTDGRWRILRDGGQADGAVPQLAQVTDSGRTANTTWNFTATATVPWADVLAGRIVLTLDLETRSNGAYKQWTASAFAVSVVPVDPKPGCGNRFLRTITRDCDGAVVSTVDTSDGVTPYAPVGDVGLPADCDNGGGCRHCTELVLCDDGGLPTPSTISGTVATGTLANGVTWNARGTNGAWPAAETNTDGGWWRIASFPNPQTGPVTYTFDHPVDVVFSVALLYLAGTNQTHVQVPVGSEVVALPPGYHYDMATGVVSGDNTLTECTTITDPTKAASARFRLRGVNSFTMQFLGARAAACGQFGNFALGGIDVVPAAGKFLRTICRGCDGQVIGAPVDTAMDGVTPYTPRGAVAACEDCQDCETLTLCDISGDPSHWAAVDLVAINGNTRVLDNGIRYGMSSNTPMGGGIYPDPNMATWLIANTNGVASINVDRPAQARFLSSISAGTTVTLPVGAVIERLAPLHAYNPAQRTLTGRPGAVTGGTDTSGFDPEANLSTIYLPRIGNQAVFDVAAVNTTGANSFTWDEMAIAPAPAFEFLRRICRGCDGLPLGAPVDTLLDGITPFTPGGEVHACDAARDCSCTPEPVCIQQDPVQVREFISNEAHALDGSVDPVWEWTPQNNGLPLTDPNFGPAANATWYDMYRPTSIPTDRWSITDTDTERPAFWITPHPNAGVLQSTPPLPGEGPNVPGNADWFGRAYFDLPANADPSSIQVQVTVLNADQYARSFRLNTGPWQTIDLVDDLGQQGGCFEAGPPENCEPYTFPAQSVPGAQAGRNTLYMRVHETVGGAAGVIAHMIVTYQVSPPARRSWTRMRCCDGTFYYLDENGQRNEDLPAGWVISPCTSGESDPVVLCDDNGPFLRHITYLADGSVSVSDTSIDGGDYTPAGTLQVCGGTGSGCAATTSTTVLCDVQDPGAPGGTVAVNFANLNGPYPDSVLLANGVTVGVDQGGYVGQAPVPPGSFFLGVSGTDPQVWTFDQPSTVRFRITPATVTGNVCLQLPAGAVVENVQPGVTHNAGTNQLCQSGSITTTTGTTVRVDNTTGFQVAVVSGADAGNNDWMFRAMEVTPAASAGGSTEFMRHVTSDCTGAVINTFDTLLDGQTGYIPSGTVGVCQGGAAVAMAATLSMGELTARHLDVVPGTPWTPAAIGSGRAITSLTYTVLAGTATVLDSDGGSIAGVPAGFTGTWTNDGQGDLAPPESITAAAGSRVLVVWTER